VDAIQPINMSAKKLLLLITMFSTVLFSACSSAEPEKSDFGGLLEISENTVREELKDVYESGYKIKLNKVTNILVVEDAGTDTAEDKRVSVYYTFDAWDNEDIVKTAAASSLEIYKRLFSNPHVSYVTTFVQMPSLDRKDELTTAIKTSMSRKTADSLNFDELKENVLLNHKSFYNVVDEKSINRSLQEYVQN
jgi:hypothetical protein